MDALPSIPTRTRNLDTSKRHTLALDSHRPPTARPTTAKSYRSSKRVTLQPASTEVISSLISSLSAISTPAEDLFDNLLLDPAAKPSTPGKAPRQRHEDPLSLSMTIKENNDDLYLHPDDAALPPVIRTAKPPSGFSPLTAPKRTSTVGGPKPSKSSPNLKEQAFLRSIGNLSIEPGPRISSDRASVISDASRGSGNSRDLRVKSSKEKVREMDRERRRSHKTALREGGKSPVKYYKDGVERPLPSPLKRSFSDEVSAKAGAPTSPIFPIPPPFLNEPSHNPTEGGPGGIGSGRIPARESSLRHNPVSSRTRNRKSYRASHVPREVHVEHPHEDGTPEPESRRTDRTDEEDQVARRIQELKSMKAQREKAQSDGEGQGVSRREREDRRKANKGRSSLPAPTASSEGTEKNSGKRRRISDPSQKRPARPISPPPEGSENHRRTPSNPFSPGRNSSNMTRDERPSTADSIDEAVGDYLTAPRLSQKIYHPQTGRAISFSDVGDPDGCVVFCCVGMGTTRFLTAFYDELASTLKLRLITLDRPGIGESEPYRNGPESPLAWPDDIRAVCAHLRITRFSILAHSAGAIYALATALRMPQHIRGRIHLLAPWIPPSQMVSIGLHANPAPITALPMSQRFLRSLPTPFLKAANSSFFSMTSTSITTSIQRSPRRAKRRSFTGDPRDGLSPSRPSHNGAARSLTLDTTDLPKDAGPGILTPDSDGDAAAAMSAALSSQLTGRERQVEYDARLTQGIWEAATTGANPAVDLLVCLERVHDIGFRYVDVRKEVVIHHGDQDSRVPLGNVKWLGSMMRAADVRVLEGEGHGLMANPVVMGDVLSEMAQDWEDWLAVTRSGRKRDAQAPAPAVKRVA